MVTVIKSKKHNSVVFGMKPSSKDATRSFGQYLVVENRTTINTNDNKQSITNVKSRTAFISVEDKHADLITEGLVLDGQIIREERFTPFYENQPCKAYPANHPQAGEPILVNGRRVWFKDSFTTDMKAVDKLIDSSVAKPVAEATEVGSTLSKAVSKGIK
jgi:hypothetical protein